MALCIKYEIKDARDDQFHLQSIAASGAVFWYAQSLSPNHFV